MSDFMARSIQAGQSERQGGQAGQSERRDGQADMLIWDPGEARTMPSAAESTAAG